MTDTLRAASYLAPVEKLDINLSQPARTGPALSSTSDSPVIEQPPPAPVPVAPDKLSDGLARLDRATAVGDQQAAAAAVREIGTQWEAQLAKAGPEVRATINNPSLQITHAMGAALLGSGSAVPVARYLGENPTEAARIAKLAPSLQSVEIGKLAATIGRFAGAKRDEDAEDNDTYLRRRSAEIAEARRPHGSTRSTKAETPRQATPARPRREESMESYLVRRQAELGSKRIW